VRWIRWRRIRFCGRGSYTSQFRQLYSFLWGVATARHHQRSLPVQGRLGHLPSLRKGCVPWPKRHANLHVVKTERGFVVTPAVLLLLAASRDKRTGRGGLLRLKFPELCGTVQYPGTVSRYSDDRIVVSYTVVLLLCHYGYNSTIPGHV
jgi:hypothetical protein